MNSPTAWITGAGGLIGSHLVNTAPAGWQGRGLTREALDLTNFPAVERAFRQDAPALVIHCAALSRSPACQENPSLARSLNVGVTAHLAALAAEIPFVFFSTDLVFDGRTGNYDETATPNPLNVYAETKVTAEQIVLRNPGHTVVRTSLNCGASPTGDRGFAAEMRRAWQAGRTLKLFSDEFRNPIPAGVTARAVWELIARKGAGSFTLPGQRRFPAGGSGSSWPRGVRSCIRRSRRPRCVIFKARRVPRTRRSIARKFNRCSPFPCPA